MRVWSLASGSSGNAYLVEAGGSQVLVECGLQLPALESALAAVGSRPSRLCAVLITHDHGDHARGARQLAERYEVPIYASAGTLGAAAVRECRQRYALEPGRARRIAEMDVIPFRVPHDGVEPLGFRLESERGRVALVTDLGHVPAETVAYLQGLDLLVLEANHDLAMLWGGPYQSRLKRRIAGSNGHLSNVAAAEAVAACGDNAPGELWLAHLSAVNNMPSLAVQQVQAFLETKGLGHLRPKAAPRHRPGLQWKGRAVAQQLALL